MKQKTNLLTSIFTLLILIGFWTVQSNEPAVLISVPEVFAQEDMPSTGDMPSADICPSTTIVCCDPTANNSIGRTLYTCEECSQTVCTYDEPSVVPSDTWSDVPSVTPSDTPSTYTEPVCCLEGNQNYVKAPLFDYQYCDNFICSACAEHICCHSHATNYVPVNQRPTGNDNCAPPHTTCTNDEPTCEFEDCASGMCDDGCNASATCTLTSGSVSISGEGHASFPGGLGCTADEAQTEADNACASITPYMPLNTPVTTSTFAYAVLTDIDVCLNLTGSQRSMPTGYYRDTDGDCVSDIESCEDTGGYWLEVLGLCINPVPSCGTSSGLVDLESAPIANLCNPGATSVVSTNASNFTWTCTDQTGEYSTNCSATRCTDPNGCSTTGSDLCLNITGIQNNAYLISNGLVANANGDCVPDNGSDYGSDNGSDNTGPDLCTNIAGVQNQAYIDSNNLYRASNSECFDSNADLCSNLTGVQNSVYLSQSSLNRDNNGRCWDANGGACGTAMNMLTWATKPQNNLCDPSSTPSTVVADNNTLRYNWTCSDIDGYTVGNCFVNMLCPTTQKLCKGACIDPNDTCLEVATTTLIQVFQVVPKVVAKSTDVCTLSWNVGLPTAGSDDQLSCSINGVGITNFNSSKSVSPGIHRIMCSLGSEFQEKTARCEINPDYKEI